MISITETVLMFVTVTTMKVAIILNIFTSACNKNSDLTEHVIFAKTTVKGTMVCLITYHTLTFFHPFVLKLAFTVWDGSCLQLVHSKESGIL